MASEANHPRPRPLLLPPSTAAALLFRVVVCWESLLSSSKRISGGGGGGGSGNMLSPASTCTGTIWKYYEKLKDATNERKP